MTELVEYSLLGIIALQPGTWADWFSGSMSALAVSIALASYWVSERHRRAEEDQRRQDAAFQIGFKLASLANDVHSMAGAVNPLGLTEIELAAQNPLATIGTFSPPIGNDKLPSRNLNEGEQNLLMLLNENDFLMDFSEVHARNANLEVGINEYVSRRQNLMSLLPQPFQSQVETVSFDLSQNELLMLQPHIIPTFTLVRSLRNLAALNLRMVNELASRFHPIMSKHFPQLKVLRIELPQDQPTEG